MGLTTREAWALVGGLGKPSKMPGRSYGLPVANCERGAELSKDPLSPCAHCYAKGGFYLQNAESVLPAQNRRLESLTNPRWVEAMTFLLRNERFFRWHDSGDVQGVWHLINIMRVCDGSPNTRHWLPTHEIDIVSQTLTLLKRNVPRNLCIRISNDLMDRPARTVESLPTGEVMRKMPAERPAKTVECRARYRENKCGGCRACWNRNVVTVYYPAHGLKERRFQLDLLR